MELKIKSAKVIPNTAHPAVGSKVLVTFENGNSTTVYQDTLLGMFLTDKEEELIGKIWKP